MDQQTNRSFAWEPFVGRGTVGGILAGLVGGVGAGLYVTFRNDIPLAMLLTLPLFAAMTGAIQGAVIGYILFWKAQRSQKLPTAFTRILIGSLSLFGYLLVTDLISKGTSHYFFILGNAVLVGGVAGFLARPRPRTLSIRARTEQALGADSPSAGFVDE